MTDKQITIRMPKKLLADWLAALRSGEYQQAACTLFDGAGYCCLGVLQRATHGDVEREQGMPLTAPTLGWLSGNDIYFKGRGGDFKNVPYLPALDAYAAEANDGYGTDQRTFAEIANAIEACAEGI